MSLRAPIVYCLPEETARVVRAAFPQGHPYLQVVDALGPLYQNPDFADLFPAEGQPAVAPAQLALVTVFQFAEGLSDRQAADAVRGRLEWKYALCLELEDPGFDASVLCAFRARLLAHGAEARLFETVLTRLRDAGLVKARGTQRTDSTHVLAAVQQLNRLELVGETLRHALNILATVAPAWLDAWVPEEWFARYARRFPDQRLPSAPTARTALAVHIGTDGHQLLAAVWAADAPEWLRAVPAVETLRQVWLQHFHAGDPPRWREAADVAPAAILIGSPYDPDARYCSKRATHWTGYKAHLTETCDADTPHLITDVATAVAPAPDHTVTAAIQDRLAVRALLPATHLVDTGYVTADHLVASAQTHGCTLLGPVVGDTSWQARAGAGFAQADFALDWTTERATCPQGQASRTWKPTTDSDGHAVLRIAFPPAACAACPVRADCVRGDGPRALVIRPQPLHAALTAARQRQHTPAFRAQYAQRAGVEGTVAQAVALGDLRQTRYRGLAKTTLLHLILATALNLVRLAAWLTERPWAGTRTSAFARLRAVPT
jgi:transposase